MRGRCQCAKVVVEIDRIERAGVVCCCSMCRRISGSPLSYVLLVARGAFRITAGREALSSYASSHNTLRFHCGTCHAPMYAEVTDNAELPLFVAAGVVDDAHALEAVGFEPIFADDLAPWHKLDWAGTVHGGAPPADLFRIGR
ncbi:MAG: hypothetical protein HOV80_00825 [Polyangiaceae bacterium]|nr:hypothetical protein [Polyangiaceae bacterium]